MKASLGGKSRALLTFQLQLYSKHMVRELDERTNGWTDGRTLAQRFRFQRASQHVQIIFSVQLIAASDKCIYPIVSQLGEKIKNKGNQVNGRHNLKREFQIPAIIR